MCEQANKVMKPFRPIEALEGDNTTTIKVWGREYSFGESAMPTSVITQGEEILSGPIRIVLEENGEEATWLHKSHYLMSAEADKAVICGIQKSDAFVINTAITVEYDGLVGINLKIVPKGSTASEVFGHSKSKKVGFDVDKLWVEIPLKREYATMYQMATGSTVNFEDEDAPTDAVVQSCGALKRSMSMSFAPLVTVTENGPKGFSYFCESGKNWEPEDENRAMEIVVGEDEVILRLRLLDGHPSTWVQRGKSPLANSYFPLTYHFGFLATPLKPVDKMVRKRRILHIAGHHEEGEIDHYDTFLATPSEKFGGKNAYDRMKEAGVTTLILHEAWNTTQNFWEVPVKRKRVIKNIIRECHARGIEFVPYFGYEISTIGPYWTDEKVSEIVRVPKDEDGWFGWYREPFQRDYIVCYQSDWKYTMIEGIRKLVDELDIDGVYMDLGLTECINENHGCGYRDKDGKLHPTFPVYGIRELFKGLYSIFQPRGGLIDSHQGAQCNFPSRPFIHSTYTGEEIVWFIRDSGAENIPLDYYNFTLSGKPSGSSVDFVIVEYPDWTFEMTVAVTIINGALPRPRMFAHLDIIEPYWKAIDSFPTEKSEWYTFKDNTQWVKTSTDDVKVSFHVYTDLRGKKTLLAFITNPTRRVHDDVTVTFADSFIGDYTAYDAIAGEEIAVQEGNLHLSFKEFGTKVIHISEL